MTMHGVMRGIGVGVLVSACVPICLAAASSSGITGFVATDAAWNRAHVADRSYATESAYDPDPSLPKANGRTGDRYYGALHESGHVLNYGYRFRVQPISQAKALVLRTEFPEDVRVVSFRVVGDSCAQMLVRSATLARAIGRRPIGDTKGTALVEFSSGIAADHYNARSVNDALVMLSPLVTKGNAPDC
jgi:hypothetical protein